MTKIEVEFDSRGQFRACKIKTTKKDFHESVKRFAEVVNGRIRCS